MSRKRRVEILNKSRTDFSFFYVEEAHLRYERYDGSMSAEIVRLNLQRGDAAAAIIHDPQADTVVMVEQFRYSTYEKGPGWLLEIPAGVVESHKDADPADTMRRELEEEIGYHIADLRHLQTFYLSPGGSSERVFLYYASASPKDKRSDGGSLLIENEDLRIVILKTAEAFDRMKAGQIQDAKSLVGLQWLQMHLLSGK